MLRVRHLLSIRPFLSLFSPAKLKLRREGLEQEQTYQMGWIISRGLPGVRVLGFVIFIYMHYSLIQKVMNHKEKFNDCDLPKWLGFISIRPLSASQRMNL